MPYNHLASSNALRALLLFALLLLCVVPALAGIIRLNDVLGMSEITPDNIRYMENRFVTVVHIISAVIFSFLGVLQLSDLRKHRPKIHLTIGPFVWTAGVLSGLSGLWMTLTFPWLNQDGLSLFLVRLLVGTIFLLFLIKGLLAIIGRRYYEHGRWMLRAYALAMGAGTQVITHIPWIFFPEYLTEQTRLLSMSTGWLINLVAAESYLLMRARKTADLTRTAG